MPTSGRAREPQRPRYANFAKKALSGARVPSTCRGRPVAARMLGAGVRPSVVGVAEVPRLALDPVATLRKAPPKPSRSGRPSLLMATVVALVVGLGVIGVLVPQNRPSAVLAAPSVTTPPPSSPMVGTWDRRPRR